MKRRKLIYLSVTMCLVAVLISGCFGLKSTQPQAMFTATRNEHVIPFTASFDATLSHDPNGKIVSYVWTFGDGGSSTGPVVDHVFKQDGVYEVTLTVFDSDGQRALAAMTVHALNPLPTAEFSYSPKSTMEEELVVSASEWITFDGTQSADDGEVISYHWDFGDEREATGPIVEHRWLWPGTYLVVLTVTDDDGDSTATVQLINVLGGQPCYEDIEEGEAWWDK